MSHSDAEGPPEDYWRFSGLHSKLEDQKKLCSVVSKKKKKNAPLGWKRVSWI